MTTRQKVFSIFILCFSLSNALNAQGIFEQSLKNVSAKSISDLNISGFIRSTSFFHLSDEDYRSTASYSSAALKLSSSLGSYGKAYADIRFRTGQQFGEKLPHLDIKEAWAAFYLKKLSFTLGKQITVWGRADGFNPTNYLGAQNFFFQSADRDDQRIGSFMLKSNWNPVGPLNIELILVPGYQPSVYRFDLVGLPDYVTIRDQLQPVINIENGSLAIRADYRGRLLEASVSYFRGFDNMPGLQVTELAAPPFDPFYIVLSAAPFREQCIGADASLVLGKTILRSEIAFKKPYSKNSVLQNLPQKELNIVGGIEREFGKLRIIAQYIGKYIPDFIPPDELQTLNLEMLQDPSTWPYLEGMLSQQIASYNRILFEQQNEWSHSIMIHPVVDLFHEQVSIAFSALYNFTTEEYMLYPAVSITPGDRLIIKTGYQFYYGPENSRFNWIHNLFTGPYAEIRISF